MKAGPARRPLGVRLAEEGAGASRRLRATVYAVRQGDGGKGFWSRIGPGFTASAWSLAVMRLTACRAADIVIRTSRDDREGGAA